MLLIRLLRKRILILFKLATYEKGTELVCLLFFRGWWYRSMRLIIGGIVKYDHIHIGYLRMYQT